MEAHIVLHNGRLQFEVNGERLQPTGYMSYHITQEQVDKMKANGCRIFFFGIYASDLGFNTFSGIRAFSQNFYVGENQYDFSELDRLLNMIAPEPEGIYIIPRVHLSAPSWWLKANPDEQCLDNCGGACRESFASQKWRDDFWNALKAMIDYINQSKWRESVIGYHIAGGATEEWTHYGYKGDNFYDYSENNQKRFREWLLKKYQTPEALSLAWNKPILSFDNASIPTVAERRFSHNGILLDPQREQNVIDFNEYGSDLLADAILWFCHKVKEYSQNKLLTGAFYGYTLMLHRIDKGHFALHRLLDSPDIDFISTTHGCDPFWPYACPVDSVTLHGKIFISEGDVRTYLTRPLGDTMPHALPDNNYYNRKGIWRVNETPEDSANKLLRSSARTLTGRSGIWWFDMFGGWFDDDRLRSVIRLHDQLLEQHRPDDYYPTEIALIVDENGLQYFKRNEPCLHPTFEIQRHQLSMMGAPCHLYLADDIANDNFPADQYKLYIFLGFLHTKPEITAAIQHKLKNNGKTLFWTFFSGIASGDMTDFAVTYDPVLPNAQCEISLEQFPVWQTPHIRKSNAPYFYPEQPTPCPRFAAEEAQVAYSLATLKDSTEPAILLKEMDGYTAIYSLLPVIPHQVLREIALIANAHIWNVTEDGLYASGNFVALRALESGEKRIFFPKPFHRVIDVVTGQEMRCNELTMDFSMEAGETRYFRIE